jgi:uncharacterized protein (DUF1501 family)
MSTNSLDFLRRDFLKIGGLSGTALALGSASVFAPKLAFAADPGSNRNTDTLVVIFQRGAMDGLNAVVPYTEAEYYAQRRTIAIARPDAATGAAIDLNGKFAFHPALAPLKSIWDQGTLSVVHAVGLTTASRSHFDAQDFMERAWLEKGQVFSGWLNRHLSSTSLTNDVTFRAVSVGKAVTKSMGGPAPVVGLSAIDAFGLTSSNSRKAELSETLEASFSGAGFLDSTGLRTFAAVDELVAKNPSVIEVENAASYPNTTFGNQMKDLAKLIKSGIGVEVATCDLGGWDTHNNQTAELANLLDELAKTLAAFNADLGTRMKNVTVLTMTEFGRRVMENGSSGTDHGRGSCMFAFGGGVVGKQVYGEWPGLAPNQLEGGDLRVTTDYRAVLAEALAKRCGNDTKLSEVFPGFTGQATSGLFVAR